MYQLTALYHHPEDTDAFDAHYRSVHVGLATKFPGLKRYTINWPQPGADGARPPYYFVATLFWDSESEFQAAFTGPEVAAALEDLPNFAGAGVDLISGRAESIL